MPEKREAMPLAFVALAVPFEDRKSAYKDVTLGRRAFTTIDAYHVIERLTSVFGLVGIGWGVSDPEYTEHYGCCVRCCATFWYIDPESEKRGEFPAVGDAALFKDSGNIAEASKKARTNLISKAASYLGCGLSVYQGVGIDNPDLDRQAAQQPTARGEQRRTERQGAQGLDV